MKLNREQIVKALECCTSEFDECDQCPVPQKLRDDCTCGTFVMKGALALIRELAEENERLRVVADMSDTTLTDALRIVNEFCDMRIKRAKADTVRKMQEELVAEPLPFFVYEGERLVTCKRINDVADKLLREVK